MPHEIAISPGGDRAAVVAYGGGRVLGRLPAG
jgi:hypothetical protein